MSEPVQAQLDHQRRLVDVDNFDVTVRELVRMAAEGELDRAPAYQRKFRWSEFDESRLIESLFLGLPVPSVFVATNKDGTWEVVDGLQRLSTIIHFVAEPLILLESIQKSAPLRLEGLEKVRLLNGQTYATLPAPLRLALNKRALRVTALSDKSDLQARFDLFERLNRGGIALSPQEVRACIYGGPFNDLLQELAANQTFRKLVKLQKSRQEDGTREELVLKFFAYLDWSDKFKGEVTTFLTDYMKHAMTSLQIDEQRNLFLQVVSRIFSVTKGPFLRKGYGNSPLNQLEAVMVAVGEVIRAGKGLSEPHAGWLTDAKLVAASTKGTNTPAMLRARVSRAKELWSGAPVSK